jgi:ankyrin repeat protein
LIGAIVKNKKKIVNYLIDMGADVNFADDDKNTPLHFACEYNHPKMVRLLFKKGANPNVLNNEGHTPLTMAMCENYYNIFDVFFIECKNLDMNLLKKTLYEKMSFEHANFFLSNVNSRLN